MFLINATHEHFLTQIGKTSKTALKNFMEPGGGGGGEYRHIGPRAKKNKYTKVTLCVTERKKSSEKVTLKIYSMFEDPVRLLRRAASFVEHFKSVCYF